MLAHAWMLVALACPFVQDSTPPDFEDDEGEEMSLEELDGIFEWRTGVIELGGGKAQLRLPEGFRYLDPTGAKRVLEEAWGNPPHELTWGMIFPAGAEKGPFSGEGWGIVLEFVENGWVSDDDADEIDYDELLSEMQESTRDGNRERAEAGYETLEIVGWAARPHYDRARRELFWAKELRFGETPRGVLNYDGRILARRGVLSMDAIASMDRLDEVEAGMQQLLGAVSFQPGHRYEDFDPEIDELAAYGIGGLIAGKLALKAGLFKGLIAAVLGAKKLLIIGAVAIGAVVTRLLRGKKAEPGATAEPS